MFVVFIHGSGFFAPLLYVEREWMGCQLPWGVCGNVFIDRALSGAHGTIRTILIRGFFVSPSVELKASSGVISMNNHCVRRSSDNF